MTVVSEIGRIPLNPQRPSRARSTENQSSKVCGTFCWLNFSDFPFLVAPDEKSENLNESYVVAPVEKSEKLSQSYLVAPDEKSENLGQQKVLLISLASAFPYCGLERGVVD